MPRLWAVAALPMILCLALIILVVVLLSFTLIPQTAFLSMFVSPFLAPFLVIVLVIVEMVIFVQLCVALLLSRAQDAVFDAVHATLGVRADNIRADAIQNAHTWASAIYFTLWRTFVLIIALPLNLIPYVGTVLYTALCGYFYAWDMHSTWLAEIRMRHTVDAQREFVRQNLTVYIVFGMVCQALEFIPVFNAVTIFSNYAGAALLAGAFDEELLAAQRNEPLLEEVGVEVPAA